MRSSLLIIALLSPVAGACGRSVDTDRALAALQEADGAYAHALVGKDRATFVGFYADDAVAYPPDDATLTGPDGMGDLAEAIWADPAFAASSQPVSVEVSADGTRGYTLDAVELTTTGSGGTPATERIRDFHVWRKQDDGSWKIAIDIWNVEGGSAATSTADAQAGIAASWAAFESAWLTSDVPSATSAFFTMEAINVPPGTPESRGREAIDASFTEFFAGTKVTGIERSTEEVEVFGDLAYERGTFVQTMQPREGAAQTQHSRYLAIWKRQPDASWRCHRFVFNNALAAI